MNTKTCNFCFASIPTSFANCFSYYTSIASIEFSDIRYRKFNTYTVDAHALQHPELHGLKNNFYHLLSLYYSLEFKQSPLTYYDIKLLQSRVNSTKDVPDFIPPSRRGELTLNYIEKIIDPLEYGIRSKKWAENVWNSWSKYHEEIRIEINRILSKRQKDFN